MYKSTKKYLIYGRVQGVGFRAFVVKIANAFDINGTVKNLEDSSVAVIATGSNENHNSFKEQLELGNKFSRVDTIFIEQMDLLNFSQFIVEL